MIIIINEYQSEETKARTGCVNSHKEHSFNSAIVNHSFKHAPQRTPTLLQS